MPALKAEERRGKACRYSEVARSLGTAGEEHWLQLMSNAGNSYELLAAHKGEMEQRHVALQLNFNSGKATFRPDSQPIVAQILMLLQNNPKLSLSVEGYTDKVGHPQANRACPRLARR